MSDKSASQDNVVSLFGSREKAKESAKGKIVDEVSEASSFEEIMRRNKESADRMKKDRKKNNQSVLRSYRIKN